MKHSEINAALEALKEIKWDKIEDKELRSVLINNHFTMFDAGKRLDAERARLEEVILAPYKEEQEKVKDLNQKMQAVETPAEQREILREILAFEGLNSAVKELNRKVEALYKEDVKGLKRIDREKFTEEAMKQPGFKTSWLEGLYPLFVIDEKPKNK